MARLWLPAVRAAVDMWAVRVLTGFGTTLSARTFELLVLIAAVVSLPLIAAGTLLVTTFGAVLIADGRTADPQVVAGLGALVVAGCGYLGAVDLARTHLGRAAYAISGSPLRGMWVAADIPLPIVVLVERGSGLVHRALSQSAATIGAAVGVARTLGPTDSHLPVQDLLACAVLGPVAYAAAGLALALAHGRRSGPRRSARWPGVVALVLGAGATGVAAARLLAGPATDRLATPSLPLTLLAQQLGPLRLGLSAATMLAIGALVVAIAGGTRFRAAAPAAPMLAPEPRRCALPSGGGLSRPVALAGVLWRGIGGARGVDVATRVVAALVAVTLAVVGWRWAGGPVLPTGARAAAAAALVFVAITVAMTVSAVTLMRLGLTRLLWQLRALAEAEVPAPAMFWAGAAPALGYGTIAALAIAVLAVALGIGLPTGAMLAIAATIASEHLIDALCARSDAGEGRRATDSVLAVLGFVALVPIYLLGVAHGWPAHAALALLTCLAVIGGLACFAFRLQRLPVRLSQP